MIFVDFSEPEIKAKSESLIRLMEQIHPQFIKNYIFTWTDDYSRKDDRRNLGITWDELPAMAHDSERSAQFAYPRG